MKPTRNQKMEYERIPKYDEWIEGVIVDIERDENHEKVFNGEKSIVDCVRFKFELAGCEFPHRSKWLTFSYGEKANLYKMFISHLVKDAKPNMDFDLTNLKGMEIKTLWTKSEDGEYDNLAMVRPLGLKFGENPEKSLSDGVKEKLKSKNAPTMEDVPF